MHPEDVHTGLRYRNLKTGNIYAVIGITQDSETLELRVIYEREEPEFRGEHFWDRPMTLFIQKFEPVLDLVIP